jgi:hypothetical protein
MINIINPLFDFISSSLAIVECGETPTRYEDLGSVHNDDFEAFLEFVSLNDANEERVDDEFQCKSVNYSAHKLRCESYAFQD